MVLCLVIFCPICDSGIIEDEFHFLFHCPKYSIPREKFYNQIQQNFVDFNQLSYTELIIKLMNSQNFSVNSHLLKFLSLCNDLRNNLLSNHADDTWLTTVIIALHYHCYDLFVCLFVFLFFMLKLLQYCNYIIIVKQIKLMLLLLLLLLLVHPFQTARRSQNIFFVALYQICIHLNANRVKFEKKGHRSLDENQVV